eukprot:Gb_22247 [translate_table: standard]
MTASQFKRNDEESNIKQGPNKNKQRHAHDRYKGAGYKCSRRVCHTPLLILLQSVKGQQASQNLTQTSPYPIGAKTLLTELLMLGIGIRSEVTRALNLNIQAYSQYSRSFGIKEDNTRLESILGDGEVYLPVSSLPPPFGTTTPGRYYSFRISKVVPSSTQDKTAISKKNLVNDVSPSLTVSGRQLLQQQKPKPGQSAISMGDEHLQTGGDLILQTTFPYKKEHIDGDVVTLQTNILICTSLFQKESSPWKKRDKLILMEDLLNQITSNHKAQEVEHMAMALENKDLTKGNITRTQMSANKHSCSHHRLT